MSMSLNNEYYIGPGCGLKKQLMEIEKHPEKYPYTNISVDEMIKKAKERIENKNNYGKRN